MDKENKKIIKKYICKYNYLLSLPLIALLIFTGCEKTTEDANARFEEYTEKMFCTEVASNTISLHYTLKSPEDYGIREQEASLGNVIMDADEVRASAENIRQALLENEYDDLNLNNKITYELLNYESRMMNRTADFIYYEEPFGTVNGVQTQLPVVLSEYRFYDVDDVDTYLELLGTVGDYFDQLISFERKKSEKGLFMPEKMADTVIEQCNAFLDMGDGNYLYSTFADRIEEINKLTDKEKSDYIMDNAGAVRDNVLPAYEKLIGVMEELADTGVNERGLAGLPEGKEYYEYVVQRYTGTGFTIEELENMTLEQIRDDIAAMQEAAGITAEEAKETLASVDSNSAELMISYLEGEVQKNFPQIPDTELNLKYVKEEMEEYLSPAFYMIPAIDDTTQNVIYINRAHMNDQLSLFTTLAHEGYPGHLYQTVYFESTDPDPIRSLLDFPGYVEGWATYAEMGSYFLLPLSKEESSILQKNSSVILGLYALADMGIHYDGWSRMDTVEFFSGFGITDAETIERIYDLILGSPGNYLKYYIGYVQFLQLKEQWIEKDQENFRQKEFHEAVLDIGPAPFDIIEKFMWNSKS